MIRARRLRRRFIEGERARDVIDDLNLEVERGEVVAVIGRSGCGKSTLLNLISGIDRPTAGEVWVAGVELTALNERDRTLFRRRHIGFVYQFFNLIPTLTVNENLRLPLELNALEASAADTLLERVGLADRADSFPDRLSGGEQQRVAIARALVHRPTLVLADEPTGNLDAETGRRVMDLLCDLVRREDVTMVLVTHAPELARRADRVVRLNAGRITHSSGEGPNP